MKPSLQDAVSKFGQSAKSKRASAAVHGEPEDQLRAPVLGLLVDLEPAQAVILQRICTGPLIDDAALRDAGVFFVEGFSPATKPAQSAFKGFDAAPGR